MARDASYDNNPLSSPGKVGLGIHTRELKERLLEAHKLAVKAITEKPELGNPRKYDPIYPQDTLCHFMAEAIYQFVKDFIQDELEGIVTNHRQIVNDAKGAAAGQDGGRTALTSLASKTPEVGDFSIEDPLGGRSGRDQNSTTDKFGNRRRSS